MGVEDVDGLAVVPWFNRERRVQLEREVLSIGDTDPEFAEHLQRELGIGKRCLSSGTIYREVVQQQHRSQRRRVFGAAS